MPIPRRGEIILPFYIKARKEVSIVWRLRIAPDDAGTWTVVTESRSAAGRFVRTVDRHVAKGKVGKVAGDQLVASGVPRTYAKK